MSDVAWPLAPGVWEWLADEARYAVQVFLVVGGFLAARGLAPQGRLIVGSVAPVLWNRYVRLVVPYVGMLLLAIAASTLARQWMNHASISASPTVPQLLAHLALLHDILGYEALSAGVWYVAIDIQLFAILLALLWAARKVGSVLGQGTQAAVALSLILVGGLALASMLHFNLDAGWDAWGLYFFGAYGLGAFAWWSSNRQSTWVGLVILAALGGLALAVEWRERLALALAIALLLGIARRLKWQADLQTAWPGAGGKAFAMLGQMSYSLFLVHFPVCLVVNALFHRFVPPSPMAHLAGVGLAWASSLIAGWVFYHRVERSAARFTWLPSRQGRALGV